MSLKDYERKRRFEKTPEPRPSRSAKSCARPIFVVQLHHARRRHYDFRLQVGDALKSWACPKGPSYDPAVKRLAVEVEDHPVSYATFQGDIPEGYGAGHVDTFDHGVWSTDGDPEAQLEKGHLHFELFGERLKGSWHLVRSGRKEKKYPWFLIKGKDAFAGKIEADDLMDATMRTSTKKASGKSGGAKEVAATLTKRPARKVTASKKKRGTVVENGLAEIPGAKKSAASDAFFKPELATLREHPPLGDDWLHEVKWDGYRILTTIAEGKVQLWSRNALSWTDKIPDIRQAIESLGLTSAQLDGELIALREGNADFNALQQTLSGERSSPLVYMLFDVPYLEGYDLTRASLLDRKEVLSKLLKGAPARLAYSSHVMGSGDEVFANASEKKLEGIMSKRATSGYRGGRGDDWLKIKRLDADEFAVVGYTAAKGSRKGFGSLLLARPAPGGEWAYAGLVGTGFSDEMLREITKSIAKDGSSKPSIKHAGEAPKGAHWINPTVVAEVYYRGLGTSGVLRQPSLKGMRPDKSPKDLRDIGRKSGDTENAKSRASKTGQAKTQNSSAAIKITHPDRVVYPDDGYTKQDVADYYVSVMEWFLPGVINRPTSVIRFPDGIDKASFFQKHIPTGGLKHVGDVRLKEETGASAVYIYPTGPDSIMELVQYNAIEFHPWGSHVDDPDMADRVVFDLDPGPSVSWARVQSAAKLVRQLLSDMHLESFLRTTGGKGLHVVVPLNPPSDWVAVKQFAQGFAAAMAGAHPMEFVATATKAVRNKKIYVDYLRNGRGATAVASYSLRGRPGAPVAMPIRWEELGKLKSAAQFTIKSAVARLKRQKKDPWAGIDKVKQDLQAVIKRLGRGGR